MRVLCHNSTTQYSRFLLWVETFIKSLKKILRVNFHGFKSCDSDSWIQWWKTDKVYTVWWFNGLVVCEKLIRFKRPFIGTTSCLKIGGCTFLVASIITCTSRHLCAIVMLFENLELPSFLVPHTLWNSHTPFPSLSKPINLAATLFQYTMLRNW